MMAESNDAVLEMDEVDTNDEGTADDLADSSEDEDATLTKDDGPTHRPWSFEYYQGFFDVDTDQVLSRIWRSFIPRGSFMVALNRKPDLYGPMWICMTLALSMTMSGNIAGYFSRQPGHYKWRFDFRHLTFAIAAVYSYAWIVPCLLWAWLWWRGVKGKSTTLLVLTCVYGYSLAIFIPSSVLFMFPWPGYVRWTLVMLSMTLSGAVLFRTFWHVIKKKDKKLAGATITVILLLHAALSVGFVMYFFTPPSPSPTSLSGATVVAPALPTAAAAAAAAASAKAPAMPVGAKAPAVPVGTKAFPADRSSQKRKTAKNAVVSSANKTLDQTKQEKPKKSDKPPLPPGKPVPGKPVPSKPVPGKPV